MDLYSAVFVYFNTRTQNTQSRTEQPSETWWLSGAKKIKIKNKKMNNQSNLLKTQETELK